MGTNRQQAFTIVELLIVIVVIGILAAITIVAFMGIQDRAYNAKALNIVSAYEKAIKIYVAEKGDYPRYANDTTDDQWVCLGAPSQYAARDGFSAGTCETWSGPAVVADAGFMTAIKDVTGANISGELPVIDYGDGRARGVQFHRAGRSLDYYVKGSQACPRGVKTIVNSSTRCVVSIE